MGEYYFDIETTGLDYKKDKIITIQYQRILMETGAPISDLVILKEFESSEEEILRNFIPIFVGTKPFDFIPVGKNLRFDFNFLLHKAEKFGIQGIDPHYLWYVKPFKDIKDVLIMLNRGSFAGYDKILDKNGELGKVNVPELYERRRYPEIVEYIKKEADVFITGYQKLIKEMQHIRELL